MSWIEKSSDDELADYLPQLVQVRQPPQLRADRQPAAALSLSLSLSLFLQALKFECHLKNSLIMFLLSRALGNINIAHYLYW